MKQKQLQTQKTNLWLPKWKGGGGRDKSWVWHWQVQITVSKMDKQQGPSVQHRNYIQYLVISHDGEEYEKECIY